SVAGHLLRVALGGTACIMGLTAAGVLLGAAGPELLTQVAVVCALGLFALHANYQLILRTLTRAGAFSDNAVIIGATPTASDIVARNSREHELNILGYFDDRIGRTPDSMGDAPFLGDVDDLLVWPRLPEVDRIIVTVTSTAQDRVRGLIDRLRRLP